MKREKLVSLFISNSLRIIVPLGVLAVIGISAILGITFYKISYPAPTAEPTNPSFYMLESSDIEVTSEDGDRVYGWWIPAESSTSAILLAPGYGMSRSDALSLSAELNKRGFNTFIYAPRGSTASRKRSSTFGLKEKNEILVALQFIKKGIGNDHPEIGVWGVDVGAYAALWAATTVPEVQAVVVDSVYASIPDFINIRIQEELDTGNRFLRFGCRQIFRLIYITSGSFRENKIPVKRLSDCSFLFITGDNREALKLLSMDLYNEIPSKKEIVPFPESRIRLMEGNELHNYDLTVADFFERSL
ncbi:MAG: hypothetical protein P8Z37_02715 [Acidobacteriota bacterium]